MVNVQNILGKATYTLVKIKGEIHFPYTRHLYKKNKKGKAISVTGREGPLGCETSRLPQFLDNRLTEGGKVVSLTCRPPFTPRKIPGTHFC
jgi:hypothetical protein